MDLHAYLMPRQAQMFDLLKQLVNINSGSQNKAGVDAVGQVLTAALAECRLERQVIESDTFGNAIVLRTPVRADNPAQILLVGHMDTVWDPPTDFSEYREDDTRAFGPGVIDMKGGLVAGVFAIKALAAVGLLDHLPLAFVCTGDEEIGSPVSKPLIRKEARKSRCALVLEVGGPNGEVVTGRKGNLSARLTVNGRAEHAAFVGADKASAIVALAHRILAIEALNNPAEGLLANVGTIAGGVGPNTVAAHAEARIDFRFVHPKDGRRLRASLSDICAKPGLPGTTSRLEILSGRPPMPANSANQALYRRVEIVARRLGIPIGTEFRSGVSDANDIADVGIPVIDGLGPIGSGDHSPREYMLKPSLPRRTLLLANLLADFAASG